MKNKSPKIAVVYHSKYGHTKKLAETVFDSIKASGAESHLISTEEVTEDTWKLLADVDAIVFGSPTYMGSVSAEFKIFADASSKPWFTDQWKNKIAAGFTNSASINGDKFSTIQYLWTLSQQHGMIWVGLGEHASNKKTAQRNDINYLGGYSGLMAQSPSDSTPEEGPLPGDLETAKIFGRRIVAITKIFVAGQFS